MTVKGVKSRESETQQTAKTQNIQTSSYSIRFTLTPTIRQGDPV